jgi:AcrR family transcriptional regulator
MSLSPVDPAPPLQDRPPGPFAPLAPSKPALLFDPLPGAHHRLRGEVLDRNHRNRVLTAAVASLAENGYHGTSVPTVLAAARVSRDTFYSLFAGKEACFLAAYDVAVAWLEAEVARALDGVTRWVDQMRVAIETILAALAADPPLARLLATEILCIGPAAQARRRDLVDRLVPLLRLGRAECPECSPSSPRLELALVSGAISIVDHEVSAGRGDRLAELAPDIAELLLAPYLDPAPAHLLVRRAPARRPAPASR